MAFDGKKFQVRVGVTVRIREFPVVPFPFRVSDDDAGMADTSLENLHCVASSALASPPAPIQLISPLRIRRRQKSAASDAFCAHDAVVKIHTHPSDYDRAMQIVAAAFRSGHLVQSLKLAKDGMHVCTSAHRDTLKQAYKSAVACPLCGHMCRDIRGIRDHAKQHHGADTMTKRNHLARLVKRADDDAERHVKQVARTSSLPLAIDLAKRGDLLGLQQLSHNELVATDKRQANALLWAAGSGHEHVVNWLLSSSRIAHTSSVHEQRDVDGRSALTWAARAGHVALIERFVCEMGMDVNERATNGTTPIMWAAWNLRREACELLVNLGADVHATNSHMCNVAQWIAMAPRTCCEGDKYEIACLQVLLLFVKHGVDPLALNGNAHSPIHKAAMLSNSLMIAWLVSSVVSPPEPYERQIAMVEGIPPPPHLRLEHVGADLDGLRPSDYAMIAENAPLTHLLRSVEGIMDAREKKSLIL